jgi:hypothetical protein
MATRVAAELEKDKDVKVEKIKGGLGEFRVDVDGETVANTNRLWYPSPKKVVAKVREKLAK